MWGGAPQAAPSASGGGVQFLGSGEQLAGGRLGACRLGGRAGQRAAQRFGAFGKSHYRPVQGADFSPEAGNCLALVRKRGIELAQRPAQAAFRAVWIEDQLGSGWGGF